MSSAAPDHRATSGRKRHSCILLAVLTIAVNLPALFPGFIHDDHRIIEQNELVRDPTRMLEIVSMGYWGGGDELVENLYRPVTILSFTLNHFIGGLHPLSYRVVNLLLHTLATLLVFALGARVSPIESRVSILTPAFVTGLLFGIHPVHAEVLGEVVGRAELFAAVAAIGSVLAFLAARRAGAGERNGRWFYALSLALFVMGFFSKENAAVIPLLVFAADLLLVRSRPAWRYHLLSAVILVVVVGFRTAVLGELLGTGAVHFVDNPIAHAPILEGRLTALRVAWRYALLLVAPLRMSIDYSYNTIPVARSALEAEVLLGLILVAVWTAGVIRSWRRAPAVAFSLIWVGIAFAPVANLLFPIGTIMAERLLYLPSVGLCLLAGAAVRWTRGRAGGERRGAVLALSVVITIVGGLLAVRTMSRLREWRDDYTIFAAAVDVAPNSVRSLFNYGASCERREEYDEAVRAYTRAIAIFPRFAKARYNLAGIHMRHERWDEAVRHYREALRIRPGEVQSLVNLGRSLNGRGSYGEGREVLSRAVAIDSSSDEAYTNLGAAYLGLQDLGAAVLAYEKASALDPGNADYQRNLGLALELAGDATGSAAAYRRGVALRPGDPDLLLSLGLMLLGSGDASGSLDPLKQAVAGRPGHPIARYHLARALEAAGATEGAVREYRAAARLSPMSPVPLRGLGLLLHRIGDDVGALEALENAAALDLGGDIMVGEAASTLEKLRGARGR